SQPSKRIGYSRPPSGIAGTLAFDFCDDPSHDARDRPFINAVLIGDLAMGAAGDQGIEHAAFARTEAKNELVHQFILGHDFVSAWLGVDQRGGSHSAFERLLPV